MPKINPALVSRLEAVKVRNAWTWQQVAEALGIGLSMLMMVKAGKRGFSSDSLYRLREAERAAGIIRDPNRASMSEQTASAARIADLAGGSEARRSSVFNQLLLDPLLQRLGELRADRDRLDREMDDIVEQLFIRYLSAADLLDSPDKKAGLLKQFEKDGLLDLLIRLGFLSPEALAQKLK